ncbi:MAG: DNA repair protein RecN [Gammaproteobacteria bacterium]|nr:DNA repair protein RecN [Gammaproteobacteria bacterium]
MLRELLIRDFAIIHSLELELGPGLTVVTGETGAGKSILVDALALALGGRADAAAIRQGCDRSEVSATFGLHARQDASRWLDDHDLTADTNEECVLRRVIESGKPSRAYINGRPVPLQMLRELGEHLVDIHSQHEHQSLLRRDVQRQILDDYAGLTADLARLADCHARWRSLRSRRDAMSREGSDRNQRLELLRHEVSELRALDLGADEIAQLEEEHARLANASELLQGAQAVSNSLFDDDQIALAPSLAQAIGRLEALSEHDARLGAIMTLLGEAAIRIDEAASQLHQYLDNLELDPQRLHWIDQRIAAVHDLARKHKVRPEELPNVLERLATELGDIENHDVNLETLDRDLASARAAYFEIARSVSASRQTAAKRLAGEVRKQMQGLGMPGGEFEIRLAGLDDSQATATGLEQAEFLVSANAGQAPRPLSKVASGGELSRISLALQVATARIGRIPTLIFDEVDVGIGGGVSEVVGLQLRALGTQRQVICITHLPQVAAQGNHHMQVSKRTQDGLTITRIAALPEKERVREIARMLGGMEITRQTLALATDMLDRASA